MFSLDRVSGWIATGVFGAAIGFFVGWNVKPDHPPRQVTTSSEELHDPTRIGVDEWVRIKAQVEQSARYVKSHEDRLNRHADWLDELRHSQCANKERR